MVGEGTTARTSLTINTSDERIIGLFETSGGIRMGSGASIETASQASLIKLLEDSFQQANMGFPPLEIYEALNVPEPSPAEPFEMVEAMAEALTAVHGFFGVRGGVGAGAGAVSVLAELRDFLQHVAEGRQDEANALLTPTHANIQTLLRTPGVFTDYSGRTFNCTAYEYAYWAKDTHMCLMLAEHMDEETKAYLLARIYAMEATGLTYQQNGAEHRSPHFDFTPLKEAYQRYLDGYDGWFAAQNWAAIDTAWCDVGKAQRDVPAHVAQEYCRPDRSFDPRPEFNEATLPRLLTFYNWATGRDDSWFPLATSNSGLGFDFTLIRALVGSERASTGAGWIASRHAQADLAAVSHLDDVRTVDLTQLRERLKPPALSHSMSL